MVYLFFDERKLIIPLPALIGKKLGLTRAVAYAVHSHQDQPLELAELPTHEMISM